MNTSELYDRLRLARVRSDSYSLDGTPKDEALILEPPMGGGWKVYYCERGLRTGEKVFATEEAACQCFLAMALCDPTMREPEQAGPST